MINPNPLFGRHRTIFFDHDISKTVRYKYLKFGIQFTHELTSVDENFLFKLVGPFLDPIDSKVN